MDQNPESQLPYPQIIDVKTDSNDDDLLMEEFSAQTPCCAHFFLPCFGSESSPTRSILVGSSSSPSVWERLRHSAEIEDKWWNAPLRGLLKVRELSEIVAGPKWKTFIRRFNRSGGKGSGRAPSKFNYDPIGYSLNFDDGPGQNGHSPDDCASYFPDFSSRYASLPSSCKSSMDLGRNGTPLST